MQARAEQAPGTRRPGLSSKHVAPDGLYETAQHYVGDLVYGANDGILTTFAVVAGVTGGALSASTVIVVGMANLVADGLSMGVGSYLCIRGALARQGRLGKKRNRHDTDSRRLWPSSSPGPCHSFRTSFPGAGDEFIPSACLAFGALFGVGAARSLVTASRWWVSGLEMLGLGVLVAVVAYATGAGIALFIQNRAG